MLQGEAKASPQDVYLNSRDVSTTELSEAVASRLVSLQNAYNEDLVELPMRPRLGKGLSGMDSKPILATTQVMF